MRLLGLDRDPQALRLAGQRLARFADRTRLVHAVYDELPGRARRRRAQRRVDGALFDLGVSSMQLDDAERGFAYAQDAPLDMRMDQTRGVTAAEVRQHLQRTATWPGSCGCTGRRSSPHGSPQAILRERAKGELSSSARLAELVRDSIPAPARRTGGHPAKRTFQALRIEVNGELAVLERALPAALDALKPGGRMVVLSLPLARGPPGQTGVRRADPLNSAGRAAVRTAGQRAGAEGTHQGSRAARRGRGGGQPAGGVRAPRGRAAVERKTGRARPTSAEDSGTGTTSGGGVR